VPRPQQPDCREVQGFLRLGEPQPEVIQSRRQELRALALQIPIRVLAHQEKEQLRIPRRFGAIHCLEILKLAPVPGGGRRNPVARCRKRSHDRAEGEQRGQPANGGVHRLISVSIVTC
jgi:hypothetical protein